MMTERESAIRHQLGAYLSDAMSLDEFTAWIVGASWNIANTGDVGASQLAYAIELALAEHSGGFLTLDELRAELRNISTEDLVTPMSR
jgi:hypothetical protein